jgi:hypothetical protein
MVVVVTELVTVVLKMEPQTLAVVVVVADKLPQVGEVMVAAVLLLLDTQAVSKQTAAQ